MNNRQMVQIDVEGKLAAKTGSGVSFMVYKIIASRGSIVTDVSLVGYDVHKQVQSCTYLLADASPKVRELVNDAFTVAFTKGA